MPDRVRDPRAHLRRHGILAVVSAAILATGATSACTGDEAPRSSSAAGDRATATLADAATPARSEGANRPWQAAQWEAQDWDIFTAALEHADRSGFDTLSAGAAIAAMGLYFVGTPYVPQTLEVPGPERLVINFRGLDCVTFVENVLALTRFHREFGTAALRDPAEAREGYERILASLRYRHGAPDGYASRLHYFSEWLESAERNGATLGAPRGLDLPDGPGLTDDPEPVDFMSTHPDAYRQLSDPGALERIRAVEADLNASLPRRYLPEDRIAAGASAIHTGDLIAATSTVPGLDIAHTGIAYWHEGELHLLHAPLVGSTVVLSERTLANRIVDIEGQDGIMVSRPNPEWIQGGA